MEATLPVTQPAEKVCPGCKIAKPLDLFQFQLVRGRHRPTYCKACKVIQSTLWRKRNPEKHKAIQKAHCQRRARRAVLYRQLHEKHEKHSLAELDALRKMLVGRPPELSSETELLAYFRGFMSGAKRTADESERFERLKDLCHRIPAERAMTRTRAFTRREYEDDLSAAYEGLLNFIRKKGHFSSHESGYLSLEHERKMAAMAIRYAIKDAGRAEGPKTRHGERRFEPRTLSQLVRDDGSPSNIEPAAQESHQDEVQLRVDLGAIQIPPRSRLILERLAQGYDTPTIGRELGLSMSRVCQVISDMRRKHPELRELLLHSA